MAKAKAKAKRASSPLYAAHEKAAKALVLTICKEAAKKGDSTDFLTLPSVVKLASDKSLITSALTVALALRLKAYEKTTWSGTYNLVRHFSSRGVYTSADALLLFDMLAHGSHYQEFETRPAIAAAQKVLKAEPANAAVRAAVARLLAKGNLSAKLSATLKELARPASPHPRDKTIPQFVHLEDLPAVDVAKGGTARKKLAREDLLALVRALSAKKPDAKEIARVTALCERASLARFAWALFEAWRDAAADMKHQWALTSLGRFGDDEIARKLAALATEWAYSFSRRAEIAVAAIGEIGTDVALGLLQGLSYKSKSRVLRGAAKIAIAAMAKARNVSAEDLEVPQLGLDASGELHLDFGKRKLVATLDPGFRAVVRTAAGERLPDLPKPGKTDDAKKAATARAIFLAFKKDLRSAAPGQARRLEDAMRAERRWTLADFERVFVSHPVMRHPAQGLVWTTVDGHGKPLIAFRVAEDDTYATAADVAVKLPTKATIAIAHPARMGAKEIARWSALFGDYELVQPFAQLGRTVHQPSAVEKKGAVLERVAGVTCPAGRVMNLLQRGWERTSPEDAGVVHAVFKVIDNDVVASLTLEPGLWMGAARETPPQTIGALVLAASNAGAPRKKALAKTFGLLGPVAFSELVHDLESLRGHA